MKYLVIYLILGFLSFVMTVVVDLLAGASMTSSLRDINNSFASTTIQESLTMIIFAFLPILVAIIELYRRKRNKSTKN